MGNSVKLIKKLIDGCSDTNRNEWTDETRTILEAVHSTSRPTKERVRRAIADAVLKKIIISPIVDAGWRLKTGVASSPQCHALLDKEGMLARVEIALLGPPGPSNPRKRPRSETRYKLEILKRQKQASFSEAGPVSKIGKAGKPTLMSKYSYSTGEFDILAVNMHAITRRWRDFRYTLSARLRPYPRQQSLINIVQYVPLLPNDEWTDDLGICLEWFSQGDQSAIGSS